MPRSTKQASKTVLAWLIGMVFVLFGVGLVTGVEIYWAKVIEPERAGLSTAVPVPADALDSQYNGKLVQVTGDLSGAETLTDADFKVAVNALRLRRRVWMWQWVQTQAAKHTTFSATETDPQTHQENTVISVSARNYFYSPEWLEQVVDSRSFYYPGHDNPPAMRLPAPTVAAAKVSLGAFVLSPDLVAQLDNFQMVTLGGGNLPGWDSSLSGPSRLLDDGIYIGANPKQPAIGDLKVRLEYAPVTNVSVIARQDGGRLMPFAVTPSASVARLQVGLHSVSDMVRQFNHDNLEWRVLGWVMGLFAALAGGLLIKLSGKAR
jgi:hypothetical protein